MNSKLLDSLSFEAKEIALSFERASVEGQGTPQEIDEYNDETGRRSNVKAKPDAQNTSTTATSC